nr:immunoglobulin light chain junction region [Macaca mulatta]MPN88033.1 immunoglobulin light chain junction region [Macaca mulatta]MPN88468.1 immunoglobulin light chain junction region [Macaca mulatta]MPN88942.1 immunoglobulin light chain junction region [Macaca mulatta]MPN89184.1 immunoglobulin light chain junction region [Macaca mulatta]
CIQALQTPYSF